MLVLDPAAGPPAGPHDPHTGVRAVAERRLRSSSYPSLRKVLCDYRDGVLVLHGALPSYYLKQLAQEVVARHLNGVERLENRIQVVRPIP